MARSVMTERERSLDAQARSAANRRIEAQNQKSAIARLAKEKRVAERDAREAAAEVEAGSTLHTVVALGTGGVGLGAGALTQWAIDPPGTPLYPFKYPLQVLGLPALGIVAGGFGLWLRGLGGSALAGAGFGFAGGSIALSLARHQFQILKVKK